jgi:hypothetical protein
MVQITSAAGRIGVILGCQSMGSLGLLVRFFLFVRCTYTYTCGFCNETMGISLQLMAPLHTPKVYALSLSNIMPQELSMQ